MPEYYLLDEEHKAAFKPFLNVEDREDQRIQVLGVVEDGAAVGALSFSNAGENSAQIRSMAVAPDWRRRGLAKGMLEKMRSIMPDLGYHRLSAIVTDKLPNRVPVSVTLGESGFLPEYGLPVGECPLSALLESPVMKPFLGKSNPDVIALGKAPRAALKNLNAELVSGGLLNLPLEWDEFSPALSFCAMPGGASVASCVCIHSWEQGVYVDWAYARPNAAKTLMSVMAAALSASAEAYGPDGRCSAVLANDSGSALLEKLAGDSLKRSVSLRYALEL